MSYKTLLCLLLSTMLCLPFAAALPAAPTPAPTPAPAVAPAEDVLSPAEDALSPAPAEDAPAPAPALACPSAALLCAENGQLLLGKNAEQKLAPASITKLMTALLVLESCPDLSRTVTVSSVAVHAIEPGSTHIALDTGEVISLRDLMGAMLVESANDAANVLAEHVGGSLEGFAQKMNERAQALGCTNTHFVNPNGLDAPEHYTTAHDMARIGQALVQYPAFFEFAGATRYQIQPTNKQKEVREFSTKQNFLRKNSQWYDEKVLAGKNGWTTNAHQTLVTFRRENDITLIAVTMGGASKTEILTDTAALFRYGCEGFRAVTVSPIRQAEAAQAAYPNADIDALKSALVLLPPRTTARSLSLHCTEDNGAPVLQIGTERENLLSIPLTLLTAGASVGTEGDGEAAAAMSENANGMGTALRGVLLGAGVLVGLFGLLCGYRWTRIRRQRRRIRAMRARVHRENTENTEDSE